MPQSSQSPLERIASRQAEIGGGITIDRVLPSRQRRTIGAWCFLDHAGPAVFEPGHGLRVGAHPHIGLQTFTWMIEGEVEHRDSLGNVQTIRPGQVNLMTAGIGISHTEESLPGQQHLHATQLWIALPPSHDAIAPAFDHYPELPSWNQDGMRFILLAGSLGGHTAPSRVYSPLVGVDLSSDAAASTSIDLDPAFEYGLLALEGGLTVDGESIAPNELAYLPTGRSQLQVALATGGRALLIGGQPVEHEVVIWWNFVNADKGKILQAQRDWEAGDARFGSVAGYEDTRLTAPPVPWKS